MKKEELLKLLSGSPKKAVEAADFNMSRLCEVRLRALKPLSIRLGLDEFFVEEGGALVTDSKTALRCGGCDIKDTLEIMSRHSLYAYEQELRNGFITLEGGHRVGVCGQAITDGGGIKGFKHISSLNLRVTHEIKGCADGLMDKIALPDLKHVMIISPPACGKTTMLRDIVRNLSNGRDGYRGYAVGLADERSEIAACYMGIPQNDVGIRTDVIDSAPKHVAMRLLLRSMSPRIIAVDELGGREDAAVVQELVNAGVKIICTVHGGGIEAAASNPYLSELISIGIFELYIVLGFDKKPGVVKGIYDGKLSRM